MVTWPAPAQLHWAPTGRAPAPHGRQDLPTFNPELSLLRLVQLYTILQNITHEAILCPSPTGSFGSIPGSSSEPTVSLSFLTSLFVSSSHHDPLSLAVLCQKSLAYSLPPGQEALLSFAQRDCNLSQALCQQAGSQSKHIQACQMQTYLSSHLLHYTSLSTFPSVVLLFLLSCMFQSPFLLPKSFFLYFIKEAPFCFMCQLLQTSIIFQQPVHVLQGRGSLLPLLQGHGFCFLLPMLYCDLCPPKCKQPENVSQSRLQPQNKYTGWSTTQHRKMDCKYFRKQQEPKCWGSGELVLHLLSCTKGCILMPYLRSR